MKFLDGLKLNTGVVLVVLTFLFQFFGLTKEDAEATIAAVIAIIGGVLVVVGYIHRIIKNIQAKKAAVATTPGK